MTNDRKPNAPRHPDERLMHREVISREYLKGRHQAAIAENLGISLATVKRDLAAIRKLWLESSLKDFDSLKAEQLAKIDTVEAEAWEMWNRSCESRVRIVKQDINAASHAGHNTGTDIEPRTGDPRYLQIALKCIERRAKLLGLDAPDKIAQTNSKGGDEDTTQRIRDMSEEELEARTKELQRLRVDNMSDDEIAEIVEHMTRGRFLITPSHSPR